MSLQNSNKFFVITGGASSGKTTIINELKANNYACFNEAARKIIKEQLAILTNRIELITGFTESVINFAKNIETIQN